MKNILIPFILILGIQVHLYGQKTKRIDELLTHYEKASQFNGTVLVAEKGKIIFEKSYGYKNAPKKEKNTNNSIYTIYSTTKIFTSTVILKLAEQGKLSLSDKLSKYFPGLPDGDQINIENLLNHTSGIPGADDADYTINEETFLPFISGKKLDFAPNTSWNYSNSNYYLLGYIIRKVSGMDYDKAISTYIFNPLQMTNSGFDLKTLQNENKALGYEFLSDKHSNEALRFKTAHPFGAGAMYSTVEDLWKFNRGMKNNKILKQATLEKAQVPYQDKHYGLGYEIDSLYGKKRIGHSGGGPGYRCRYFNLPEDDITVILLCNAEMNPVDFITSKITSILYNKPYEIPQNAPVSNDSLQKLEGIYSSKDHDFCVKSIDGLVIFNERNYPRNQLFPISANKFQLNDNFTFTFKPTPTGEIDSLLINFPNGNKLGGKKVNNIFVWGIAGSATPNGSEGLDIPLNRDPDKPNIYYLNNYKLNTGDLRFRLNNDPSNSYALNNTGELTYNGYDIKVQEGVYDIVLDMTDQVSPRYTITKSAK